MTVVPNVRSLPAARCTRAFASKLIALRKQRAWGMPDAQWHPQPRVQKTAITHTSIHSEAPETPG
ncbi:MAG: hypothetical protein ABSG20_34560, partial [Bradyrhizobium sp.]